jgi:preprotein translocase subunit SecE
MAETDNPDAPLGTRAARFSESSDSKAVRRERNQHSLPSRLAQFLRDTRAELRRTSWPSVTEVKNTTIITIIAVIFFAIYLFAVDQGLSRLILGLDWLLEKVVKLLGFA